MKKRIVFEYPENDLEETKVIAPIKEPKKSSRKTRRTKRGRNNLRTEKSKNKLPIILAAVLISYSNSFSHYIFSYK